jgi:hypothetical protein
MRGLSPISEVRMITFWLSLAFVAVVAGGCGASSQPKPLRATDVISQIGAIPGKMPSRLCSDNIYAGSNGASVVRTPDDVVVGPLRFGTLRQATGQGLYTAHTPDGLAYGIKSPLSISGTSSPWVALRVAGDANQVKVSYDSLGSLSGRLEDPRFGKTVMALQSAVACGNGASGFVQYNGGFAWLLPTCAILQAFDQTGHLLGSKRVPFGKKECQ